VVIRRNTSDTRLRPELPSQLPSHCWERGWSPWLGRSAAAG